MKEHFPFTKFFENAPQPVFKGRTYAEDMDIAEGCFRHIKSIFKQLEEFHAFELLRSGSDRFVDFIYFRFAFTTTDVSRLYIPEILNNLILIPACDSIPITDLS